MFDNLKDKLGSFRKDAEEAAEENVEAVDDDELEDEETEASDSVSTDAEATDTTTEPAAAESATAAVESDSEPERGADAASDVAAEPAATTESAGADAADAVDRESATESEPDSPESADPDSVVDGDAPGEAPAETAAPEAEQPLEEDESDDADDGGRTGLGARARSLFTGSSDGDSASDEAAPEEGKTAEATPDAESTETAAVDEDPDDAAASEADPAPDEADPTTDDTETEDDADAGGNATGFGTKAKSLVKGKFVIEEEDLEGPLHELEMALLSSDVEMGVAEEILDNIRDELVGETRTFTTSTGEVVEEALYNAIYDVISVGQFDFDERIAAADKPITIIFTGVNGVGKTTSIAKLSRYFEDRGYSSVMANGDTYRAGANEQIQEHADALDTKCISHEQGGDPAAVLYDAVEYAEANDIDVVLGDTAGRLHTDEGLMDQLEKIGRVVDPDMTLFVDEAVAGQDAVNRAREFNEAAEIDGAILTKADADSNGGAAISIAHVTGKPILFLGVGQGYDDLERFDPDEMVDRLLADDDA
ncbi:signal recognition particle-docking protein FtsY [Natrinema altunense]|uniref:Signal recognition particle receptor FtsY n=1 Tax=Natrinema altunense TaxID=222984 RepID=A0A482Y8C7_9EURY|nr:signal recognition particle-docking protein FtsY [Natrinema altunense]RZH69037.1 signal recognition particle-docking protein FtsY [Natrinema altunense]